MQSTFTGIEIGKRSLITHTQGLGTIGHNISNAAVEGYSRQRVQMGAFPPLYFPGLNREETPGQLGQGVQVERIERIKDMILEERIVAETNSLGFWESRNDYILMMEQVYNEPMELSVRGFMDRFWESWQELSLHPSEMASRKAVLERGQSLMDKIHDSFAKMKGIRDMIEEDVQGTVKQANNLLRNIASLNEEIEKVKALGDNPNDLLDRRDLLVQQLSVFADVTIGQKDPDEFIVYIGGYHVVQGRHFEPLDVKQDPNNEGYSRVIWKGTDDDIFFRGGKLAALLELRDADARGEIQKLDLMTANFIDLVNEVHSNGYGLNNETGTDFFTYHPFINNAQGNYDRTGDGVVDSSYIFRINGMNKLKLKDQIGLRGTLTLPGPLDDVTVDYFPSDTVEDVINKINLSGAEIVARLNIHGELSLKGVPSAYTGNPDFVLRHMEDSGQFLVGYAGILPQSGPGGAYDWQGPDAVDTLVTEAGYAVAPLSHPAAWIEINAELVKDPGSIATSSSPMSGEGGPGDGSVALAVANLRTTPVMIGQITTFDDFFADAVASIGLRGEQAEKALETENLILKELNDIKQSISGVNMDEELANMVKFQHGYSAAARFVSEIDKMLDVIINRMGV
ncbi:MAG: flagellar hook-associated protein FlgK [Spirochaetales bacterium]|nr:flagellar hook-associated protein FlgK [Spirochaetales bacterium]